MEMLEQGLGGESGEEAGEQAGYQKDWQIRQERRSPGDGNRDGNLPQIVSHRTETAGDPDLRSSQNPLQAQGGQKGQNSPNGRIQQAHHLTGEQGAQQNPNQENPPRPPRRPGKRQRRR